MVLKKMVDYGFQGYRIPAIPRGPRSVRKRGPQKKLAEDSQICAIELLAAVAGKLLQENESSGSSNAEEGNSQRDVFVDDIIHEQFGKDKGFRFEGLDQGGCVDSARDQKSKAVLEEILQNGSDCVMEQNSIVTSTNIPKDVNLDLKLEMCADCNADGDLLNKVKGGLTSIGNTYNGEINNGADRRVEDDKKQTRIAATSAGCLKDPTNRCVNINPLIKSHTSVHLPLYRDPVRSASFAKHWNNVNLGIVRDDDENSFGCNSTKIKVFRPQSRFGYRRIRKILGSKYWRVAPKLKDSSLASSYEGMKPFYRNRKNLYPRERFQRETPSKRRKICEGRFVVACNPEASGESISNSPDKPFKGDNKISAAVLQRANGPSGSVKGLQNSRNANVKFSIKSFKVPELYIEVAETATVGALKRTVMEAVTAILEGGLRVGVALKGKRVRDDKRTLQQAGISDNSNLEALGFTLEPSFNKISSSMSPKQPAALHPHDADQRSSRSPAKSSLAFGLPVSKTSNDPASVVKTEKPVEVNREVHPGIHADASVDISMQDSKALVQVPAMNVEALAVIPVNQKPKCSELPQRRTRRPFSVTEVEALVEAVEKLGTGRWRDVKMSAFDNADHRTYVDLKDKWKTLVHTASIAPQQRRGEPVPQELLDRVLSAHAYWSQHQSKHHI